MKRHGKRLLALLIALMLAVPAFALAVELEQANPLPDIPVGV